MKLPQYARLGDVWYEVLDVRQGSAEIEYKLYSREDEWIPYSWISAFQVDHAELYASNETSVYIQLQLMAEEEEEQ